MGLKAVAGAVSGGGGGSSSAISGTVTTYADLPTAADHTDELYRVTTASGVIFVNRKPSGVYLSDGSTWVYVADFTEHDQASEINNDSGVAGATVADALDNIDTDLTAAEGNILDLEAAIPLVAEDDLHLVFLNVDGTSDIAAGTELLFRVGFSGSISKNSVIANASGSIVFDIEKSTYAGFPTTTSICASAKPTLSSAQKSEDGTLTGWTTTFTAGDVFRIQVDSCTGINRATLSLFIDKDTTP